MGRIERVAAVDAARADHVDRRRLLLHHAHLDGRGLRAQADVGRDPERVRLGLRRVVVGRVERGEVVVVELDLGALGDAEAEPDEDVLDLALDLRQQVRRAARHGVAGQRHVDGVGAQGAVELGASRALAQPRVQPLELAAHAVQLLAARPAQLGRQRAELAQRERQRARAPERLDACILELRGRRGPLELFAPLALQAGRVLHGLPASMQGRGSAPPRYHPACAVPAPLAFARSTASRPAREVNFGGPSTRGLSVTAPLPVEDGAPPTRLRRRRSRHSTAYAPRTQQHRAASPTSGSGRSTTAGAPASTRRRLLSCSPARARRARSSSSARAAAASRSSSRAHGHGVIALDAAPAMLAQAERRARRDGVGRSARDACTATCAIRPSCRPATA